MNNIFPSKEIISEKDLIDLGQPFQRRKILLLGGHEVGKTALIKRYKNNIFLDTYEPTIQIITKKIIIFNNEYIDLEIVDLDGQTQYTIFSPNKYSFGLNGYMLIYSVREKKSFELIKFIYEQINLISGRRISKVLVGTKSDINIDTNMKNGRQVPYSEGKNFAEKIHCPFIEVSSKDNKNIEDAFRLLIIEINKTESGINLKKLKFFKVFEYFIHHEKCMKKVFFLLLFIELFLGLLSASTGVWCEIENKNSEYSFDTGFPLIILGIWIVIFSICCFLSIEGKNVVLMNLSFLGFVWGLIILLVSFFHSFISLFLQENNNNDKPSLSKMEKIIKFFCFLIILISICLSRVFLVIYQKDLKLYMA